MAKIGIITNIFEKKSNLFKKRNTKHSTFQHIKTSLSKHYNWTFQQIKPSLSKQKEFKFQQNKTS